MCGRFGRLSRFERIAQMLALKLRNEAGEVAPSYNVAPGTLQPVILGTREGAVLRPLLWGLVPYWAKDPKKGARPINAQCETAAEKPMGAPPEASAVSKSRNSGGRSRAAISAA